MVSFECGKLYSERPDLRHYTTVSNELSRTSPKMQQGPDSEILCVCTLPYHNLRV